MSEVFYPADTLPDPMDVVWGLFPYDERKGLPGPICHPCLVFETNEFRDGCFAVKVVFGTSSAGRGPREQNFVVSNYAAQIVSGLCRETFFDLGRFRWLPWSDRWFQSPDLMRWPTPVIGRIPDDGQHVLRYTLDYRRRLGLRVP